MAENSPNEKTISRFDFPVFYEVLEKYLDEKRGKITKEKICSWLLNGAAPKEKNATGIPFNSKYASGNVAGTRLDCREELQKLFRNWEILRSDSLDKENAVNRTGKEEVKHRLDVLLPNAEDKHNVALDMKCVLEMCTEQRISEERDIIQAKYFRKEEYWDYLAEVFRLAFCCKAEGDIAAVTLKDFVKYKPGEKNNLIDSISTILKVNTERKYSSSDAIRSKLWNGTRNTRPSLPIIFSAISLPVLPVKWKYRPTETAQAFFAEESKESKCPDKNEFSVKEIAASNKKRDDFCLLLGPGGTGKTTSLADYVRSFAPTADMTTGYIPLYLDLSSAPDTDCFIYQDGISTFIRRAVDYFSHSSSTVLPAPDAWKWTDIREIEKEMFSHGSTLLLLDGLNEVSRTVLKNGKSVFHMICEEILDLAQKGTCKIIVTSRTEDGLAGRMPDPCVYTFCEPDEKTICNALKEAEISEDKERNQEIIDRIKADPILMNTLRLPLFLSVYVYCLKRNIPDASTQGELLRIFFHEKKEEVYTVQGRNYAIDETRRSENRFTALQQAFIIDFILPKLAWDTQDQHWLDRSNVKTAMESILQNTSDTSVCGNFGIDAFTKYTDENNSLCDTHYTASGLKKLGFDILNEYDSHLLAERITEYCVSTLGFLERSGRRLRFSHQVFRDYFVCAHGINVFRIAAAAWDSGQYQGEAEKKRRRDEAFRCLGSVLAGKPLNPEVRRLIGEALGEHYNAPYFEDGQWHRFTDRPIPEGSLRLLTERMLDVCRNREGDELGYTVFNLLHIMAGARPNRDLSGVNLDGIDLRLYNILGTRFSRPGLYASFVDSKIRMYPNCREDMIGMAYNAKKGRILTYSSSGMLYEWDEKTLVCTDSVPLHSGRIYDLKFSADGQAFYTVGLDRQKKHIKEWSAEDYSCKHTAVLYDNFYYTAVNINPQNNQVLVFSSANSTRSPNITIKKIKLTVHVFDRDLIPVCPVQIPQIDLTDYCPEDTWDIFMRPIAIFSNGKSFILHIYWASTVFKTPLISKSGLCGEYFLLELDDGKFLAKEKSKVHWFGDITYCENTPYFLTEKNGILKKYDIRTQEWSVISDSFQDKLCSAYYNDREKKYILQTNENIHITDSLNSLQNVTTTQLPDNWSLFWCSNSPYIGLEHMHSVEVWDIRTSTSIGHLTSSPAECRSMDVTEDGRRLVTLFDDGTLMLFTWDERAGKYVCSETLTGRIDRVYLHSPAVWWTKDGEILVYAHPKGYLVKTEANECTRTVISPEDYKDIHVHPELAFLRTYPTSCPAYDKEKEQMSFLVMNIELLTFEYKDGRFHNISRTLIPPGPPSAARNPASSLRAAGRTFTLQEDGSIEICRTEDGTLLQRIPNLPNLLIQGVDLSRLKDSGITEKDRELLRLYGANIEDESTPH